MHKSRDEMKKLILNLLIVTMLFSGGTANATAVGLTALSVPVGGAVFAVALAAGYLGGITVGVGVSAMNKIESGLIVVLTTFGIAGIFVLLDEDRQVVEFGSIDPSNASKYDLTEYEVTAYNKGLPEINLALDELSKRHNGETTMTREQAIAAYNEVAIDVGLSSGARSALSKIFAYAYAHTLTEKQSK